jgi:hypothetical protein
MFIQLETTEILRVGGHCIFICALLVRKKLGGCTLYVYLPHAFIVLYVVILFCTIQVNDNLEHFLYFVYPLDYLAISII